MFAKVVLTQVEVWKRYCLISTYPITVPHGRQLKNTYLVTYLYIYSLFIITIILSLTFTNSPKLERIRAGCFCDLSDHMHTHPNEYMFYFDKFFFFIFLDVNFTKS